MYIFITLTSHCVSCNQYLETHSRPEMDPVMVLAVSRRPRTAETRARSLLGPREICSRKSVTGIGFFPRSMGFSCQYRATSNQC
jgi:hypothetical protein